MICLYPGCQETNICAWAMHVCKHMYGTAYATATKDGCLVALIVYTALCLCYISNPCGIALG